MLGGTDEARLHVTYNYYRFFVRVLGKNDIRTIYGLTPQESIPILAATIAKLGNAKPDPDYWKDCTGTRRRRCSTRSISPNSLFSTSRRRR